ncbi:MAG: efflux RND transporter periplasmic adaptor subunit [Bacteroidales bacterium]
MQSKSSYIWITLLLTAACGSKNIQNEPAAEPVATNVSQPAKAVSETNQNRQEPAMDGESGATNVANHTSFNGILIVPPQKQVTVGMTMGGALHTLNMLPGQFVRRGAVLATLRNPEFIDLQQQYLEAAAQAEYLEKEFNRQERLSREEAASRKRFEQSRAEYLAMKARKEGAAAQLTILGVRAEELPQTGIRPYLEIKAPIEGYIAAMKVNPGTFINPGDKICDVVSKGDFMLLLTAYEKDLGELEPGKKLAFRVNGMQDEVFEAELVSIGQQIDEISRSLEVYARVRGGIDRFRPGMYVTARIENK